MCLVKGFVGVNNGQHIKKTQGSAVVSNEEAKGLLYLCKLFASHFCLRVLKSHNVYTLLSIYNEACQNELVHGISSDIQSSEATLHAKIRKFNNLPSGNSI